MASRPPEGGTPSDEAARTRWLIIQTMRVFGIALVILGIAMARGAVDIAGEVNRPVGFLFIVVGLVDGFAVPQILARKWRTPPA